MGTKAKMRRTQRKERFDLSSVEPIQLDDDTDEPSDGEVEQLHLFSIGEKEFWVDTQVDFVHAVRSMEIAATRGEAAAVVYQLRVLLGDDGYEALINHDRLRQHQFEAITRTANKIVMSSFEGKAQ
jgi:hypothetical protein